MITEINTEGLPVPLTGDSWSFGWAEDWDEAKGYLLQRIFGSLVRLAQPVVNHYQGDLYWDAKSVSEITDETEFYYAVRPNGTHFHKDWSMMEATVRVFTEAIVYRCKLFRAEGSRGQWYFEAAKMER